MNRAEQLRPFAEAPCPGPGVEATSHEIDCKGGCHGSGYDPRFDALRGEHEWVEGEVTDNSCRLCGWNTYPEPPYCLRTDLGALLDTLAACGWDVAFYRPLTVRNLHRDGWAAMGMPDQGINIHTRQVHDTHADAAAELLTQVVPLG